MKIFSKEKHNDWVEKALFKAKETLLMTSCPSHVQDCEHGRFLEQAGAVT